MRFWRKKQTWKVIAALLFAVWILMGDRKINVKAESMETENFTGETAVETEEEITKKTTEKTVTAGMVTVQLPLILTALRSSWFLTCLSNRYRL